ncbi:MAG: sulfite exporter TauE/SafE family protein [Clostridia bacterium]|nr:sulfite exporter TauE/SafE family protein [Clostridia bacterium]
MFLLTTFAGIEQHMAQGTNLIFFIPTSIVAIIVNIRNKNVLLKTSIVVIVSGVIGAVIGAKISVNMNVPELRRYFGYFLIIIEINEIYSFVKTYVKPYIKSKKANNKNI